MGTSGSLTQGGVARGKPQPHGLRPHVTSLETRGAGLPAPGHSGTFPALPDVLPPPPRKYKLAEKSPGKENPHFEWNVVILAFKGKSFCC